MWRDRVDVMRSIDTFGDRAESKKLGRCGKPNDSHKLRIQSIPWFLTSSSVHLSDCVLTDIAHSLRKQCEKANYTAARSSGISATWKEVVLQSALLNLRSLRD